MPFSSSAYNESNYELPLSMSQLDNLRVLIVCVLNLVQQLSGQKRTCPFSHNVTESESASRGRGTDLNQNHATSPFKLESFALFYFVNYVISHIILFCHFCRQVPPSSTTPSSSESSSSNRNFVGDSHSLAPPIQTDQPLPPTQPSQVRKNSPALIFFMKNFL